MFLHGWVGRWTKESKNNFKDCLQLEIINLPWLETEEQFSVCATKEVAETSVQDGAILLKVNFPILDEPQVNSSEKSY